MPREYLESLMTCLVAAPTGEVAARDQNAGFIRQGVAEQSLCRLKSAFLAKDSGEHLSPLRFQAEKPL
jgi:hypothetical protein